MERDGHLLLRQNSISAAVDVETIVLGHVDDFVGVASLNGIWFDDDA